MAKSAERTAAIDALVAEVGELPLPEMIAEYSRLVILPPWDASAEIRQDKLLAAAYCWGKIISYLAMLDQMDELRIALGKDVREALAVYDNPSNPLDVRGYSRVAAGHLSGLQEVSFHFFVNCIRQIGRMLPEATREIGFKLKREDYQVLEAYYSLRDFFEHMDQRLPRKPKQSQVVRQREIPGGRLISIGFDVNGDGDILIDGQACDVSSAGVANVRAVVAKAADGTMAKLLSEVKQFYERHPEVEVPAPDSVKFEALFDIQRFVDRPTPPAQI